MIIKPKEYITFGNFDTKSRCWYLESRDAPSPAEKEFVESIPFMQGVLDFSNIFDEKTFENREITYEFKLPDTDYKERKLLEQEIKRELTKYGIEKLYDTHDVGFYWLGKCKSVKVEDDAQKRSLIATIVFDCYPFMLTQKSYFDDVWDTFNFDTDIAGFTKYIVNEQKDIILINTSEQNSTSPKIICNSNFEVSSNNKTYYFKPNDDNDNGFILKTGINKLTVKGNGTISFRWNAEVMG